MIYLETDQIHYTTREYFRKHVIDNLPNILDEWAKGYRVLLAEQGCEIVRQGENLLRDGLDVAPGYDRFLFRDEQAAILFSLKWM